MIKKLSILLVVFSSVFMLFSQGKAEHDFELITEDINNFWRIYDQAKPKFKAQLFEEYIENGTDGLQAFMSRIGSAKNLAKKVKKSWEAYEKVRVNSLNIKENHKEKIQQAFIRLKKYYPKTIFPDVYFVFGRMNAGGIATDNSVIIGYEISAVIGDQSIASLVTHEAIHVNQKYEIDQATLLSQTVMEGAADFLSDFAMNEKSEFNHHNDPYGLSNEKALWEQFKKDMENKSFGKWLYGGSVLKGSPEHMGYWMGYQIVKAYFIKSTNKREAIQEILNIGDFEEFLEESGYAKRFQ